MKSDLPKSSLPLLKQFPVALRRDRVFSWSLDSLVSVLYHARPNMGFWNLSLKYSCSTIQERSEPPKRRPDPSLPVCARGWPRTKPYWLGFGTASLASVSSNPCRQRFFYPLRPPCAGHCLVSPPCWKPSPWSPASCSQSGRQRGVGLSEVRLGSWVELVGLGGG